jgi:hypothetical protein
METDDELSAKLAQPQLCYLDAQLGLFLSNRRTWEEHLQPQTSCNKTGLHTQMVARLLDAGLCGSSINRFSLVKAALDLFVNNVRGQMIVLYGSY